jgi:hypothetical protein
MKADVRERIDSSEALAESVHLEQHEASE